MKVAKCCEEAQKTKIIIWKRGNTFCGPDKDGWAIGLHGWGDVYYENISFCPFCGKELEDGTKSRTDR